MEREFYSVPEAAALLGLSRIAVFKKVKKGQLAAIRFGRNWAVPASALESLLERPSVTGAAAVKPPESERPAAPRAEKPAPVPPAPSDEMDSIGWD